MEVVELKQPEKKPAKGPRPRFEGVVPASIVDVWRMVEREMRDGGLLYPDVTEDEPEVIRSHLFQYLQGQTFMGIMARSGKRPVGMVLGHVQFRPFGRPSRFAYIQHFWVEPGFREQGIGPALWREYGDALKRAGIFAWERPVSAKELSDDPKGSTLIRTIGGRL